ncbi:MAG: right-handed parallel beta-helix repeat-containing protein [bacterium]
MRSLLLGWVVVFTVSGPGCGSGGGDTNQNNTNCPAGFEAVGPACAPLFDDCSGPAEIAVLGGGCQPVGVTECTTGLFTSDGRGGCEPILPPGPNTCPPGTMEALGQTECRPVGVSQCAAGFVSDGQGGCDAVLPPGPDPCPHGTIVVLGDTTCQPLGDCGTGAWGNIVDDPTTLYVDQTADATGADGTQQAPFTTVADAMSVVVNGGQIAVAAGEYLERINITSELRLTGRCAELVTLRGATFLGQPKPPVTINSGSTGTTIRGVTLTGPAEGLMINGGEQLLVEEVEVTGTETAGISVTEASDATFRRVKIAGCAEVGILWRGSTLALEESVIRGIQTSTGGPIGRGFEAQCDPVHGACGSLSITRSVVAGNQGTGLFSIGVHTTVTDSVFRDSQPQTGGAFGRGIDAACDEQLSECGSLTVVGSLVAANHAVGIVTTGVDTVVTDTVVRDTLPQVSDGQSGRGVAVRCNPFLDVCGSLTVTDSVIAGNTDLGLFSQGVETHVAGSVVRDTQPNQVDGTMGRGISIQCDNGLGACGDLTVTDSLVSGNREAGIAAAGVAVTVTSSMIRDTRSMQLDGWFGNGIVAACDTDRTRCGRLDVLSSVISGNRDSAIFTAGVEATVTASVVRDTQPREVDDTYGKGLFAECHPTLQTCGSLLVASSVFSDNTQVGIFTLGVDTVVSSTTVRDTWPQPADERFGMGIGAQCVPTVGACGSLRVSDSSISRNVGEGIYVSGVATTVERSIVRDTLESAFDGQFGNGIGAACDEAQSLCAMLDVSSSLIAGNTSTGISTFGVDATITSTVVRDTAPTIWDGRFGRGINAQCTYGTANCGSLDVTDSLVRSSYNSAIFISGVPTSLDGVAAIETHANDLDIWHGQYGQGVFAICNPFEVGCSTLQVNHCLIEDSDSAGLAVIGTGGNMSASVIRQVAPQPLDGKFGYGVQIEGEEGAELTVFHVTDAVIADAALAGVLYYRAAGTLARSVVSGGENSVLMNEGSAPTILQDNNLSGTVEDDPVWANLFPSPAPAPTNPSESTTQE